MSHLQQEGSQTAILLGDTQVLYICENIQEYKRPPWNVLFFKIEILQRGGKNAIGAILKFRIIKLVAFSPLEKKVFICSVAAKKILLDCFVFSKLKIHQNIFLISSRSESTGWAIWWGSCSCIHPAPCSGCLWFSVGSMWRTVSSSSPVACCLPSLAAVQGDPRWPALLSPIWPPQKIQSFLRGGSDRSA